MAPNQYPVIFPITPIIATKVESTKTFIVFAETGLFAGFFLPGDSLLFLAGIYSLDLMLNVVDIPADFINVFVLSTLVAIIGANVLKIGRKRA